MFFTQVIEINHTSQMTSKILAYLKHFRMQTLQTFAKNLDSKALKITLCDQNMEMAKHWQAVFEGVPNIEILRGSIFDVYADAIVSPANSFGDMGGGIDHHIDNFYEGKAQKEAQRMIQGEFMGEMPMGMARIISMKQTHFPFLIVAPTMRIPCNFSQSLNAYLAMRAILVSILKHNQVNSQVIGSVAISGLCTGVGRMPYQMAAEQMQAAYNNIYLEQWKKVVHPAMAPYALFLQKNA